MDWLVHDPLIALFNLADVVQRGSDGRTRESLMKQNSRSIASRRCFLKQAGAVAFASLHASSQLATAFGTPRETMATPSTVTKSRTPLAQSAFYLLPLGSIRPSGWLKQQLQIQAGGLSGHLDETWPEVGANSEWLGGTREPREFGPYFLDGLIPLAYLLDDAGLKAKAQRFVEWTLTHQAPDGMIGPASSNDWWPRMVMLKALAQYQEATGDPRVIPLMTKYFAYQLSALPSRPLRDWGRFRWQDNALVAIWLYNRTGDAKLLDLVRLLQAQGHNWQAQFADFKFTEPVTPAMINLNETHGLGELALATHGVNNGQALKTAAVWSLVSNSDIDRDGFQQMQTALDRYHGLPNGMFSCDEHYAGRNPSQGSELCAVVETMFSLEQSLAILGEATIGDRLETIAFNALPGTFTDDMWAHQYDQEPNQVEVSLHKKPWTTDGPESNLYGLEPNFGCCTANFHQGWPKFTASLWMYSNDDGLVAALYSPCEVHTRVRDTEVHIIVETDYPFRGTVRIKMNPAIPIKFPFRLRIPAWGQDPSIVVNGIPINTVPAGKFAKIDRTWEAGDVVELRFPMVPRTLKGYNDSISVYRGPLVFSLPIGETWVKLRDRGMTADWQVYPSSQWNYGLCFCTQNPEEIKVEEFPVGMSPFALAGTPVKLQVKARKVPAWYAVDGAADPVPQSPVSSNEPIEKIILVPYAAAKLRITAFPELKS
jgi:hypothetical protein